jgi:hypothetical protein
MIYRRLMSRYAFFYCVCTGILLTASFSQHLAAQIPPRSIQQIGPNLWVAGLPTPMVIRLSASESWGRQRRENWCWAASVQMALNVAGIRVTQEQVVERIYGGDIDRGGTPQQIMEAMTGWAPTISGTAALLNPLPLTNDSEMIDDLSLGWPLIVGLTNPDGSGHAEVITAVTYGIGPNGAPVFRSVILRDPWPYNASRVEMSWPEFSARRSFAIRNRVTYPSGR